MHVALYSVAKGLLDEGLGDFSVDSNGQQQYSIEASKKTAQKKYVTVALPVASENKFLVGEKNYKLGEHHLTIFESQSMSEKYLSAYHYTGYYSSDNETFQIRVYFDKNDRVAMECPQVWPYADGKQGKLHKTFFDNSGLSAEKFIENIKILLNPVITVLRTSQKTKQAPLDLAYEEVLDKMEDLSKNQISTHWDTPAKEAYLQNLACCFKVLEQIKCYSNNPLEIDSLIAIHQSHFKHLNAVTQDTKKLKKQQQKTKAEPFELISDSIMDLSMEENPLHSRMKALMASEVIGEPEAFELNALYDTLKADTSAPHYNTPGILLSTRKYLSRFCVTQLSAGNANVAEKLYSHLTKTPREAVRQAIERDDHSVIKSLIDNDVIPLNLMLDNNFSIFEAALLNKSLNCLAYFVDKGLPLTSLLIKLFEPVFSSSRLELNQIFPNLLLWLQINNQINSTLSFDKWDRLIRVSMDHLIVLRETHLITLQERTSSSALQKSSQLKPAHTLTPVLIPLLDIFISIGEITLYISPTLQPLFEDINFINKKYQDGLDKDNSLLSASIGTSSINMSQLTLLAPVVVAFAELMKQFTSKLNNLSIANSEFVKSELLCIGTDIITYVKQAPQANRGDVLQYMISTNMTRILNLAAILNVSMHDFMPFINVLRQHSGAINRLFGQNSSGVSQLGMFGNTQAQNPNQLSNLATPPAAGCVIC